MEFEPKKGMQIRNKANHKYWYVVTSVDKSDKTLRGMGLDGEELGWSAWRDFESLPHTVKVISIQKGKANKAEKPEVGAAKLRKAKAAVEALKEYEKFL